MRRSYSRQAVTEERRNVRKAGNFVLLTIGAIILLFFLGIPLLGRFTAFVSDLGKSNKSITSTDKTPPAPPAFDNFSEFTNQTKLTLNGRSESGAQVKITFNGEETEVIADKDGKFSFNFDLQKGENGFSAVATDSAGNVSQRTKTFTITFDNDAPDLTVDKPADGAQFYGSSQRQIVIEGKTDPTAELTINDRVIALDSEGKFQFATTLSEGSNTFNLKSVDAAGNKTEKSLTVSFNP